METKIKHQIIDKMAELITVAFGLVAALAWNDAIKGIFTQIFGTPDKLSAQLAYAIVVTVIAIIITIWIGKLAGTSGTKTE